MLMIRQLERLQPPSLLNFAITSRAIYNLAERFLCRTLHLQGTSADIVAIHASERYTDNAEEIFYRPVYFSEPDERLSMFILKCKRLKRLK